jgi:uncharacterized protein YjdB
MNLSRNLARTASAPFVLYALAACGGGDGGSTGPAPVARVEVTVPGTSLDVGQTVQVSVRYFDAQNAQLGGRTVSYSSSSPTVAGVSGTGLVTAIAAGNATISALVDGVSGSVSLTVSVVPVAVIAIGPPSPSVLQGQSLMLTAQTRGPAGQLLSDRPVTWSSANPARATVNDQGLVTGVTAGYAYIRASSEGRTDSANFRVRSLTPPVITAASAGELAPGATGNVTGTNFGAGVAQNAVFVNGVQATITAATSTSVDFTIPARGLLPCTATGPAQVMLVANSDTSVASITLRVATPRTLAIGESLILATQDDLLCNELVGNGGRYLFTAFNYASNAGIRASVRVQGSQPATAASIAAGAMPGQPPAGPVVAASMPRTPSFPLPDNRYTRHLKAHAQFMAQDRELARQLGNPRLHTRPKSKLAQEPAQAAVEPPSVGDIAVYRMRRSLTSIHEYDEVNFRVVYSGSKIVIMEDQASPVANTMNDEYVRLGEEFDNVMFGLLSAFGDPLVSDAQLDDNGRLIALFSPRVNEFEVNGVDNQVLGYVTICDFFPIEPPPGTAEGEQNCRSSNEGEFFYALVPDPTAGWSIGFWRRLIRGTLIHEAKHIGSYAWRWFLNANVLEELWLEEATAQQASEMWARTVYGRGQGEDIRWADGPLCDYAPDSAACPDPAEGILHHFSFLYDHYANHEQKSILNDPFGSLDAVVYGSSWSFIRYVTDNYAASEAALLGPLVQVQNDRGVANVVARTGVPFSELLGMWSLASVADNYPGVTLANPKLQLGSWHSRDLFSNMSQFLRGTGGAVVFPLQWPMQPRQVTFGTFATGSSTVSDLKGGGFVAFELSGAQAGPQALAIRSNSGGAPPANVGMAIVRIQ